MEWLRRKPQDIRIKSKRNRSYIQKNKCDGVGTINIFPGVFYTTNSDKFWLKDNAAGHPGLLSFQVLEL